MTIYLSFAAKCLTTVRVSFPISSTNRFEDSRTNTARLLLTRTFTITGWLHVVARGFAVVGVGLAVSSTYGGVDFGTDAA